MNPAFLDNMSWEMAEVYGAVTDQIMINLAKYFPYFQYVDDLPRSAFTYQATMLAQMGKVDRETIQIIRNGLEDADLALKGVLEQAVIEAVRTSQPELLEAVKRGVFAFPSQPILTPNQMRAYQLYYQQAADKLNLVNTVMLESTHQAYQGMVSDVVSQIGLSESIKRVQLGLDTAAGETITGVSTWNQALQHATNRMKEAGIVGFIDHGGHRWSAEAYAAMDIRTTVANTARAAVWETNQSFGNDLYSVSYHDGARPKCYPWQNQVISANGTSRTVVDLYGNEIHVFAQSETSYGAPDGLFGINCKHYPTPFIPGVSVIEGSPQSPEENKITYEQSQEQRRLERKLREDKRDLIMAQAQGAPPEEITALRNRVNQSSQDIDDFCQSTGRARHRDREAVYTKREFPDADKYDVSTFTRDQKNMVDKFYHNGGSQTGYTFGQMTPKVPIIPIAPPPSKQQVVTQNVASQATTNGYGNDMFDGVKGVDDSFKEGMAKTLIASGNDDAIKLYGKYAGDLKCVNPNGRGTANYSRMRGGVTMNLKNVAAGNSYEKPYQVAFHEFGHMIDDLAVPGQPIFLSNTEVNGKRLLDVIKSDYKAFKKSMGASTNDDLIIMLKKEFAGDTGMVSGNISDILEKCTNRSYPLGVGHGVGYHRRDGATEHEFFAEVLDSAVTNPESYQQMVRLFPNAVDMVWEMIRGVN